VYGVQKTTNTIINFVKNMVKKIDFVGLIKKSFLFSFGVEME